MPRMVLGFRVDCEDEDERNRQELDERLWQKGWDSVPLGGFAAYRAAKEERAAERGEGDE